MLLNSTRTRCVPRIKRALSPPPSSRPFTPLSMWMESAVGITLPLKDQKIADFLRKEPRTLSWKVLPDYSNRSS